jgi:cell wall-associated NlpC family hydrolase
VATRRHLCYICGVNTDVPLLAFWRRILTTAIAAVLGASVLVFTSTPPAAASPAAAASGALASGSLASGSLALLPATPSKATLDKQIDAASNQLEIVIEQYDAVQDSLQATKAREAAGLKRLAPLQTAVDGAQAGVAQVAAQAYEATPLSSFALLVDAPSAQAALDGLLLLDRLAVGRQQDFDALSDATRSYREQQQTLVTLDQQQTSQYTVLAAKKKTILKQIASLKSLRLAAYGPSGVDSTAPVSGYVPAYAPGPAGTAVKFAYDQIGKPYKWAADGPGSYDCSGLTLAAWRAAGVSLPHNSAEQYSAVAHIAKSDLQPGDLVFYYSPIHHVAIYIGDGHIIHAPNVDEDVQIAAIGIGPIHGYGRP